IPNMDRAVDHSPDLDGTFLLLLIWTSLGCSSPAQRHPHIAGHAPREFDDLYFQLVTARAKIFVPQFIDFLRHAGQRLFPGGLLLVDGAALVSAQLIGKAMHLDFREAIVHGALDDLDRARNRLLV